MSSFGNTALSEKTDRRGESPPAVNCELPRSFHEVERLVGELASSWSDSASILQSRQWHRIAFCEPIAMTPLDEETGEPIDDQVVVVGRDISLGGVSFIHLRPLPFRRVALSFVGGADEQKSVVTELTWCRFRRDRTYIGGGRFLRTIHLPIDPAACWTALPRA